MLARLRQRPWSIQAQFLMYSLALLVPALVFSGLMILRSASLERKAMELDTTDVVRSVAFAIDRELSATITTLKALASSPSLAQGDLKAFYAQAMAAQEVSRDHFFLTSPTGRELMNTRVEFGAPLPETSSADWKQVLDTDKPLVSNLYEGSAGSEPMFSISVPVQRRKRTIYVLSASISPERILRILENVKLADGWVATVSDRAGVVIARSADPVSYTHLTLPTNREV